MGLRRRVAATAVALAAVTHAACAPALPESVVPGTHAVVGVTGEVTSSNPLASPTPANLELAAATRAGFGAMVDGEFVPDPSFGTVTISGDDPVTVRSASSRISPARRAARSANCPKRTSASAKARSVCIGTWPATSWKMSGSGR